MAFGKSQRQNKIKYFTLTIALLAISMACRDNAYPIVSEKIKPLLEIRTEGLADGDIIFRTGRDLVSSLVLTQGDAAQFSHVGVILKQEGQVSVVHSLPEGANSASGVQIETLTAFTSFDSTSDVAVYRLKGIDSKVSV